MRDSAGRTSSTTSTVGPVILIARCGSPERMLIRQSRRIRTNPLPELWQGWLRCCRRISIGQPPRWNARYSSIRTMLSPTTVSVAFTPTRAGRWRRLQCRARHASRPRLVPTISPLPRHGISTAGKYATAAALLRQRVFLVPGTDFTRAVLASALGHLGQVNEARRVWHELKEINPKYSFREHFSRQPARGCRTVGEGLTKAGLPN